MSANQIDQQSAKAIMSLGIGRLFRLLSRPYQPGDEEQYFMAQNAVLDAAESLGMSSDSYTISWQRDRLKGAQGD